MTALNRLTVVVIILTVPDVYTIFDCLCTDLPDLVHTCTKPTCKGWLLMCLKTRGRRMRSALLMTGITLVLPMSLMLPRLQLRQRPRPRVKWYSVMKHTVVMTAPALWDVVYRPASATAFDIQPYLVSKSFHLCRSVWINSSVMLWCFEVFLIKSCHSTYWMYSGEEDLFSLVIAVCFTGERILWSVRDWLRLFIVFFSEYFEIMACSAVMVLLSNCRYFAIVHSCFDCVFPKHIKVS